MPITVCNEPVRPLGTLRSPRVWGAMLAPDLPGKRVLIEIQLNHGLANEEKPKLDQRLLALYSSVIQQFGRLHGDGTRCFLVRAPESVELVGLHIQEFGGASNGIACLETVFCVSPRTDTRVKIAHVDNRFPSCEFDLHEGLPKTRILDWAAHVRGGASASIACAEWANVIKGALQYYLNRHKGPTGQVELNITGLNIVVGAVLPEGVPTHSETSLAGASLVAAMAASGEWGKVALADVAEWIAESERYGSGRKSNIGLVVHGMPGEVVHINWNPVRAKSHALAHGHSFIVAHTGLPDVQPPGHGRMRATTTHIAFALLRQAVVEHLSSATPARDAALPDEVMYEILRQIPERVTRNQALEKIKSDAAKKSLQEHFKTHAEPQGGYLAREKLLFVLAEMHRAARASNAIRRGEAAELGALMNIGQAGEAGVYHELSAGGLIQQTREILSCSSDDEIAAMADHVEALWKQAGRSAASTPETDLLCDLALGAPGVLGARWTSGQRIAIICKSENVVSVMERLNAGYYSPRNLPPTLAAQVYPSAGLGVLDV